MSLDPTPATRAGAPALRFGLIGCGAISTQHV